ncbi:MAG: PIN domain-containing protein [Pseudomonadota bacterium]|nr:PIN domain-containing protein [Pseudomonadota bacterium]MDP1904169.1 PIN domain-containing protein [Pseudomonadota bacterium]
MPSQFPVQGRVYWEGSGSLNIVIYFIKNKPPSVAARINALEADATLCMSFFTYAELLKGAERSTRKDEVLRRLDRLARLILVPYGAPPALCEHYARHANRLKLAGTPIGCNDLWIACHALAEDSILVTNNTAEFTRIEGLRLENWAD